MKYADTKTFLPFFLLTLCYGTSLHSTQHRSTPDAAIQPNAATQNDAQQLHVLQEQKNASSETKCTLKKKVVSFSKNKSIIPWAPLPIAWTMLPGNGFNN